LLVSATVVQSRRLSDGGVELEVVFEVAAVEGQDSAAAITQDLLAAGNDPNLMAQLQQSIATNLQEVANITTSVTVLSVSPELPTPTELPEDPPPPLRAVPTRGVIPYYIAGGGTALLLCCFAFVCRFEVKKQKSYRLELEARKAAGKVANLGEENVKAVANAAQAMYDAIAQEKAAIRNGGNELAEAAAKEGKKGGERDLDDTSSSDDNSELEEVEPISPSEIILDNPPEPAVSSTKESEAKAAAGAATAIEPTGVPTAA
jgi:hypothetical protein